MEQQPITIIDTVVHLLNTHSDITGEYETDANLDFVLNEEVKLDIFGDIYTIDRIKLLYGHDHVNLYYANKSQYFYSFPVKKEFVDMIQEELFLLQDEQRFRGYQFCDELQEYIERQKAS